MNILEQKTTKTTFKNTQDFFCEICHYKCVDKSNFKKHFNTQKHKKRENEPKMNIIEQNSNITTEKILEPFYACKVCDKKYKNRNGLWYHRQKCIGEEITDNKDNVDNLDNNAINVLIKENMDFKNIILDLVKSNGDLQKQMIEVCRNSNTNNITTTNSHNKTFNMQVFLNEKCKDAMNIMDFVNSMTLQLSDLEDVGELGYVEGISKIIIKKLNEMDVYKRPIHCSDYKREVMYVRDDDIWEKENSTYDKLRKAIKHITKKNGDLMIPWRDKNPLCMNTNHRLNDIYLRIMNQSMGGKADFVDSENKIIKKISKAVYIDKEC